MKRQVAVVAVVAVGITAFLVGAAFAGEAEEEMHAKMPPEPPAPPGELKALDVFVGEWRGEYEHLPAMFGEAAKGTGRGKCEWILDNWVLKWEGSGTSTYGTHKAVSLTTYDPQMQTYRSYEFDNFGMVAVSTMTYDRPTKTWTLTSDGMNFTTGQPAKNKSTLRFVSDDKFEWEWSQQTEGETEFKPLMRGTDTRVGK